MYRLLQPVLRVVDSTIGCGWERVMNDETGRRRGNRGHRRGHRGWGWVSPVVLVLAGVLASVLVAQALRSHQTRAARDQFEAAAEERTSAIAAQLRNDLGAVHALAGFFDASEAVERHEFHAFARPVLETHPSIYALAYSPRVSQDLRARHRALMLATGFADYRIRERLRQGLMVPAAERAEYFPVMFLYPEVGRERAIGFDLTSESRRRAAVLRAMGSGRADAHRSHRAGGRGAGAGGLPGDGALGTRRIRG